MSMIKRCAIGAALAALSLGPATDAEAGSMRGHATIQVQPSLGNGRTATVHLPPSVYCTYCRLPTKKTPPKPPGK